MLNPFRTQRRHAKAPSPVLFEGVEPRKLFSTYVVTTAADDGAGSLRQAIKSANSNAGADVIQFKIGSGAKTITTKTGLPYISGAVTIDGTTQPGYAGKPLIELNGSTSGGYGLNVGGGGSTIKGLAINGYSSGILIVKNGYNTVKNCYIGVGLDGKTDKGNQDKGIIVQTANNVIGGTTSADRNVISGNGTLGVQFYTYSAANNKIQGNYIGTDATGSFAVANGTSGIAVYGAPNILIGGTAVGARNIISGNLQDGVVINTGGATGTVIQNNYIGTDVTGTQRVMNGHYGIETSQANTLIGGTTASARNVVSGNGYSGIVLWKASADKAVVQGNYVGTDATGTKDLGNYWRGIDISNGASNARIEANVVSGNDLDGIMLYQGSNNLLKNNTIGFNAARTAALKNFANGVRFTSVTSATATGNYVGNNDGYALFRTGGGTVTLSGNTIKNDEIFNLTL